MSVESSADRAGMGALPPGSTVGILGGGQLGRMMAIAAASYGLKTHIFAPDADSPAFEVAGKHTVAGYEDEAALVAFAAAVDVVTYEFENIPAESVDLLRRHVPLFPDHKALATTQDRLLEKRFVAALGIPTAPFRDIASRQDLVTALADLGAPAILKTRRFGYDGKGQVKIEVGADLDAALAAIGHAPAILEGFVPFVREVSVVGARDQAGAFAAYDVCENVHRHHILDITTVPSALSAEQTAEAIAAAKAIADALSYVGVLAVEMFVLEGGDSPIVVNEIAPRVHNSGHWTIEGAVTSQFAQHIRAVCGWPLGSTRRNGQVEMRNLIGDDVEAWADIVAQPGLHLHLYGKASARPGRKMGHVTRVLPE
ncbi:MULTISPECIES: 5-(carboxyamino)imidazole ribonucleotide synthase [unclassified Chelatococcus]|uniref:5-(carboxyamino)imidazole ribonucleotide synthase n=1 Tax=unclassified Chelatococcus TaxID=2638111 RepID=UPI0020BE5AA5|nr:MULTISPECIES: 5-(carboxyamino)imidazole ribonucleotide synthase [unclassified Chelatococcus]MCO5077890.1 5-(carboxyamino)imidazole ribonucleotide synthase [Chelatococcus sp.]CAH1660244.1 N5-carboxyaminoimidazole ribonucleotide synthase [Hyphomicrobiales bacterium]CAH1683516.1 N5-carboxyaminoimidazole ribonucleotide synthase [Hyphomicrobiales bacterium]